MPFSSCCRHCCICMQDGTALSIDLLGSCFTDQLRPPALTPHHISQYLCQGRPATAQEASGNSPDINLSMPGLPSPALRVEASLSSVSNPDSEHSQLEGVKLNAAGSSLLPEASTLTQVTQHSATILNGEYILSPQRAAHRSNSKYAIHTFMLEAYFC